MNYIVHKNHVYAVLSHSVSCGLMTIKKDTGTIERDIKYNGKMKVKDFLERLEKINFFEC